MNMLRAFVLVAMALPAATAMAQSAENCPTLPKDSGLEWVYQQGPDFGVCYAIESASRKNAFGIYLGSYPSFDPDGVKAIGKGMVGGRKATWYPRDADEYYSKLSRQAIVKLEDGYVAHVWLGADDEKQLQTRLSILKRVEFKN